GACGRVPLYASHRVRQHEWRAVRRYASDRTRDPKHLLQHRIGKDIARRTIGDDATMIEHDDAARKQRCPRGAARTAKGGAASRAKGEEGGATKRSQSRGRW